MSCCGQPLVWASSLASSGLASSCQNRGSQPLLSQWTMSQLTTETTQRWCVYTSNATKTNPFRHGVDIFLGRTDRDLWPVSVLLAFMAVRPAVQGPLFVYADCSPLTRERLVEAVRRPLERAGVSGTGYSGHSFRIHRCGHNSCTGWPRRLHGQDGESSATSGPQERHC